MGKTKIAIIGGGPGGLLFAQALAHYPDFEATIFERSADVGGKSLSIDYGGEIVEFGTCYAVLAHRNTIKDMKRKGITLRRMTNHTVDGNDPMTYMRSGTGSPLAYQALKYLAIRHRYRARHRRGCNKIHTDYAEPTLAFLERNRLNRLHAGMYRMVTGMGYGDLANVPIYHTMQWVDWRLLMSGLRSYVFMPVQGWQEYWRRVAKPFDVRCNSEVTKVVREANGVRVTANGETDHFDYVVNSIPMEKWAELTDVTPDEAFIAEGVDWQQASMTLFAADWFTEQIRFLSQNAEKRSNEGRLMGVRREGYDPGLGKLYCAVQMTKGLERSEIQEIARFDAEQNGASNVQTIDTKSWQYFPCFKPEALAGKVLDKLTSVQGVERAYFTGATFSHEAVSAIELQVKDVIHRLVSENRQRKTGGHRASSASVGEESPA